MVDNSVMNAELRVMTLATPEHVLTACDLRLVGYNSAVTSHNCSAMALKAKMPTIQEAVTNWAKWAFGRNPIAKQQSPANT